MDQQHKKPILIWLYAGALLIFTMVIVGGITRLTHSGLSMVEWKLIMGTIPPLSEADWQDTFAKYQAFPEYEQINSEFTLEDFKGIFWWEYLHRMIGRLLGLVFIFPFLFFLWKKWLDPTLKKQLLLMFFLGGFQGFLGWFMVASGLVDNPSVSHYRLAAHLITATILLGYIFWVIFGLHEKEESPALPKKIGSVAKLLLGLVLLQIVYGAFVAGLKAGFVFNTFPKMGDSWFPIAITTLEPLWKNFTEGLAGVQFIHRYLAFAVVGVVGWLWALCSRQELGTAQKQGLWLIIGMVLIQFSLGVSTLLLGVPILIAVLHQAGAMLLLISVVHFLNGLRQS
ncbi:MAG: COX15/CtaA family protein [Flavobacteriales bacterium]|nr:COX15/CtaA family protein [Flavobacteriales bacterium]